MKDRLIWPQRQLLLHSTERQLLDEEPLLPGNLRMQRLGKPQRFQQLAQPEQPWLSQRALLVAYELHH